MADLLKQLQEAKIGEEFPIASPDLEKVKRKKKCSRCGKVKRDVKFREDPYQKEINNKHVMGNFCNACNHELLMDI